MTISDSQPRNYESGVTGPMPCIFANNIVLDATSVNEDFFGKVKQGSMYIYLPAVGGSGTDKWDRDTATACTVYIRLTESTPSVLTDWETVDTTAIP